MITKWYKHIQYVVVSVTDAKLVEQLGRSCQDQHAVGVQMLVLTTPAVSHRTRDVKVNRGMGGGKFTESWSKFWAERGNEI